jgi:hypothetical protein
MDMGSVTLADLNGKREMGRDGPAFQILIGVDGIVG